MAVGNCVEEKKQLTINHVLDRLIAVVQGLLRFGTVRVLSLELGPKEPFIIRQLLELRLVLLLLVRQFLG